MKLTIVSPEFSNSNLKKECSLDNWQTQHTNGGATSITQHGISSFLVTCLRKRKSNPEISISCRDRLGNIIFPRSNVINNHTEVFSFTAERKAKAMSSSWEAQAAERASLILEKIPHEWRLSSNEIVYARAQRNITSSVVCKYLNRFEQEVLSHDPISILRKLGSGEWTAVQCILASCKIACIAHQIVCFILYYRIIDNGCEAH